VLVVVWVPVPVMLNARLRVAVFVPVMLTARLRVAVVVGLISRVRDGVIDGLMMRVLVSVWVIVGLKANAIANRNGTNLIYLGGLFS
jgi:hypothetical protein